MFLKSVFLNAIVAIILTFCLFDPASAAGTGSGFLGLSLGQYNTLRKNNNELDFRVEYRAANPVFLAKIKPWMGIELTTKATFWAGGGIFADLNIGENVVLTPSLGIGYYAKGHSDFDLDYPVQFRSQIDISYVFQNDSRLGLALSHMSNAHLGDHNPGSETLALYYFLPISAIFR